MNPKIAAIVAGVLALLLVIYVLAGGSSRSNDRDKLSDAQVSGAARPRPESLCASQKTYDSIKDELFRQAADLRGDDAATFRDVASYSFLRMTAPKLTRHDKDSGMTACAGSLALDLPPGLSVAGGRRTLAGNVGYALRSSGGAEHDAVTLSGADAIITPLATLSRSAGTTNQQVAKAEPDQEPQVIAAAAAARRPQLPEPRNTELRKVAPRIAEPLPAARAAVAQVERAAPRPARVPKVTARTSPTPAAPRTSSRPSFNCRNARTRGEIAVCGGSDLATLDRQMASQFNRAVSSSDRGKRVQLERSRSRFLRFRDTCSSEACMAGAYRDRMREIDDIMNERWSPR